MPATFTQCETGMRTRMLRLGWHQTYQDLEPFRFDKTTSEKRHIIQQVIRFRRRDGDAELSIICIPLLLNIMDPRNLGEWRSVNRKYE